MCVGKSETTIQRWSHGIVELVHFSSNGTKFFFGLFSFLILHNKCYYIIYRAYYLYMTWLAEWQSCVNGANKGLNSLLFLTSNKELEPWLQRHQEGVTRLQEKGSCCENLFGSSILLSRDSAVGNLPMISGNHLNFRKSVITRELNLSYSTASWGLWLCYRCLWAVILVLEP